MKPELRIVVSAFSATSYCKEPPTGKTFKEGDLLIAYDGDGAHVLLVREKDTKKAEPFITSKKTLDENTKLAPSSR